MATARQLDCNNNVSSWERPCWLAPLISKWLPGKCSLRGNDCILIIVWSHCNWAAQSAAHPACWPTAPLFTARAAIFKTIFTAPTDAARKVMAQRGGKSPDLLSMWGFFFLLVEIFTRLPGKENLCRRLRGADLHLYSPSVTSRQSYLWWMVCHQTSMAMTPFQSTAVHHNAPFVCCSALRCILCWPFDALQ